jgi:hypothetical protein
MRDRGQPCQESVVAHTGLSSQVHCHRSNTRGRNMVCREREEWTTTHQPTRGVPPCACADTLLVVDLHGGDWWSCGSERQVARHTFTALHRYREEGCMW